MAFYRVDTLIRHLRLAKGMSQDQLANGVCARDTLSRIERGVRKPDWYTFERLMQRLGENPKKYWHGIVSATDWKIMMIKKEIDRLLKAKRYGEASRIMDEIEHDDNFQDCFNRQFIMRVKAMLAQSLNHDYEHSKELALHAIRTTIPDFDAKKIDLYALSYEEIYLIVFLSANSFYTGDIKRALEMMLKLKKTVDRNYLDDDEKERTYPMILYNIARLGMNLERYELAKEMSDEGLAFCRNCSEAHFPAQFLYVKAFSYFYTGNRALGRSYIRQALAMLKAQERGEELESTVKQVKELFNINLQPYVERI